MNLRTTRMALATVASCAATLGPVALAQADVKSQPAGSQATGATGSGPPVMDRLFTRTLVGYSSIPGANPLPDTPSTPKPTR
jgi:hypothetical protein